MKSFDDHGSWLLVRPQLRRWLGRLSHHQAGFTLVELLMATATSLILLTGIAELFVGTKISFRMQDDAAFMGENAQFAADILQYNIHNAGFFGGTGETAITVTSPVGLGCPSFAIPTAMAAIQGYSGGLTVPIGPNACIPLSDYQLNSDILVLRHAAPSAIYPYDPALTYNLGAVVQRPDIGATQTSPVTLYRCCIGGIPSLTPANFNAALWSPLNNAWILRSKVGLNGEIIQAGATGQVAIPATLPMDLYSTTNYLYKSKIFFIRTCSDQYSGPGLFTNTICDVTDDNGYPIPTLVSYSLEEDGNMTQVALVEGVEMMRLAYGVDTDGDQIPNQYVVAANVVDWSQVVTVQVSLVLRSQNFDMRIIDKQNPFLQSFTMAGAYTFTPATDSATSATLKARTVVQKYTRMMFTKVIQVRNRGL